MTTKRRRFLPSFQSGFPASSTPASVAGSFFVSCGIFSGYIPGANGVNVAVPLANKVVVVPFYIPFAITITKVSTAVGTASAGDSINLAVYDFNKNLLLDSGALSTTTGAGAVVTATVNVTIQPGWYFFAYAATSTTPTFASVPTLNASAATNTNLTAKVSFTAANVLAAGAMPATLGALTQNAGGGSIVEAVFQSSQIT
jgi:hypothetical protein